MASRNNLAVDTDLFPYDQPREAQVDGMSVLSDVASENGYAAIEGACGTGKTILALVPLLKKVRSRSTDIDRILVITDVKQQRRAFEEAVRDINNSLPEHKSPVTALTLTGKSDVDPFVQSNTISAGEVYEVSEDLREATRDLVEQGANNMDEKRRHARKLYKDAEVSDGDFPYGSTIPFVETDAGDRIEYSPYYARHLAALYSREMDNPGDGAEPVVPFSTHHAGVITPEELVDRAAKKAGTAPYSVMRDLLTDVDVLIANYNHVFESRTVERFTGDVIDDSTLLVVDEAHNLVPSVRELLGEEATFTALDGAANEVEEVVGWLTGETSQTEAARHTARQLFSDSDYKIETLQKTASLLRAIHDRLGKHVESFLEDEYGANWRAQDEFEETQVQLRDPEKLDEDALTQWLSLNPEYTKSDVKRAQSVLKQVHTIRKDVYEEHFGYTRLPETSLPDTGPLISNWVTKDVAAFFRQISLRPVEYEPEEPEFDWQRYYSATLELKNCIPREEISDRLDIFGGGILMSATLAPFEVFEQITGLDIIRDTTSRPVVERRYGLPFPEHNRTSLAVSATDFRYNNRGSPTDRYGNPNLDNNTRKEYADAILAVVETTPGNVLVSMPSYGEAEWAGKVLERDSSVPAENVIIDESGTDWETEQRKQRFFRGGKKVLVTGAHATLVEGVDYEGDKLAAAVVCGVPLPPSHEPYQKAIQTAYQSRFGERNGNGGTGFDYAFSLPAIYKARQTLGRVIRSDNDVGARVLVDKRYADTDCWGNVRRFFPDEEQDEFTSIPGGPLENRLSAFWKFHEQQSGSDN